jgi:hypothetical protein
LSCEHKTFKAIVAVNRLEDRRLFTADVKINCEDCGLPFQFLGLPPGFDTHGACCSLDGLEARLAICPKGTLPSPAARLAFGIRKLES